MPSTLGITASSYARPWTPLEVDAELWLDANDIETISHSSGIVSSWSDKSGNNRDAFQNTEGNRPSIGVTTLAGKNVISFNGSNTFFRVEDFYAPLTNIYSVVKVEDTVGVQHIARKGYTTTTDSFEYLLRFNDTNYQIVLTQEIGVTSTLTVSGQATTSPQILGYDWNGSSVFLYRNGTSLGGTAASFSQFDATQELRIGASHSSTSDSSSPTGVLNGYIAELVIVSGSLSLVDRQKLEGYFAHKWALTSTLPTGHPYTEVAPTVN